MHIGNLPLLERVMHFFLFQVWTCLTFFVNNSYLDLHDAIMLQ